jgi:transposase-like protein
MKKHKVSKEVKEQIINRIKNEGISVSQVATEHGLSPNTIYAWISRNTEGGGTLTEVSKLKRENKALLELVGELTLRMSNTQKKI